MAKLIVTVDDDGVEFLKEILENIPYVREIVVEDTAPDDPIGQLKKIQTILNNAKGKGLFDHIADSVEWQRGIRKGWDRSF